MTIGERIRLVRKEKGLSLDKFGAYIGLKQAVVSLMENGKSKATDQTIILICREFGIREDWLRTGDGPMKETRPSGDELDTYLDKWGLPREFRNLFLAYRNLKTDEERAVVRQFIRDAASGLASEDTPNQTDEADEERWEREAREEAEEYYRLRLMEKRQIEEDAKARGLDGIGESSKLSAESTA